MAIATAARAPAASIQELADGIVAMTARLAEEGFPNPIANTWEAAIDRFISEADKLPATAENIPHKVQAFWLIHRFDTPTQIMGAFEATTDVRLMVQVMTALQSHR